MDGWVVDEAKCYKKGSFPSLRTLLITSDVGNLCGNLNVLQKKAGKPHSFTVWNTNFSSALSERTQAHTGRETTLLSRNFNRVR